MKKLLKTVIVSVLVILVIGFLLIQLVPYGHNHTNPPVIKEPNWDSPQTRVLAQNACFDCHSNETVWPWYTNVAPFSWLIQHDVEEGRRYLNFSAWGQGGERFEPDEVIEVIREGEMPPAQYLLMHPQARLTDSQKEQLIQGLMATR
jgi:cytochrome c551/c552